MHKRASLRRDTAPASGKATEVRSRIVLYAWWTPPESHETRRRRARRSDRYEAICVGGRVLGAVTAR